MYLCICNAIRETDFRRAARDGSGDAEAIYLALEMEAIPLLRDAIEHCESVRDYASRELFERILESEEEHVDFLETQFDMIARMGLENYVQLQSKPAGEGD